jgi:hypothetical protein
MKKPGAFPHGIAGFARAGMEPDDDSKLLNGASSCQVTRRKGIRRGLERIFVRI